MYIIAAFVTITYGALFFLSAKEDCSKEKFGLLNPFCRAAQYLYKHVCIIRFPLFQDGQVDRDLKRICRQESIEQAKTQYYIKKIALSLLIILAGTFFAVIMSIKAREKVILTEDGTVVRGSYQEGEQQLNVKTSAVGKKSFHVNVAPRRLTEAEMEEVYREFAEKLPQLILGANGSLERISEDLQLLEEYEGYPFMVEWTTDRPDLISGSGEVRSCETVEKVALNAVILYADKEWTKELVLSVVPKEVPLEEQVYRELEQLLAVSEQDTRLETEWKLPQVWQGRKVEWKQVTEDYGIVLWITAIIAAVAVYFLSDKDLHEKTEEQKRLMKKDYPQIVQKLVLYLGAGMTVRGAFQKVAAEYEQKEGGAKRGKPAYEEMLRTCRELQAGISEGAAYERFGKRSGLQEYVRFSTLLTQNLKKGNNLLLGRLQEEAARAYEEKMQTGRRLTEEAVTKLLLPMIMMLAVIMVIVMIPAFSTMGT